MDRRLALAGVAALAAVVAGCGGHGQAQAAPGAPAAQDGGAQAAVAMQDPNNPLIGRWRFVGFGAGPADPLGCATDMVFTATLWAQVRSNSTSNSPVTYIPSPKTVYVVGMDGGHITYILVDPNHIALESSAPCAYERVAA